MALKDELVVFAHDKLQDSSYRVLPVTIFLDERERITTFLIICQLRSAEGMIIFTQPADYSPKPCLL